MKFRKEFDSIGQINVPVDKYWGASTQRSKKYFDIGEFLVRPILIKSIAIIKKAAAIVHHREKQISSTHFRAIIKASDEVISGTLNFNKGNNIVILDGQAKTYRGLEGDDTYFVSQLLPKSGKVSITDTEGSNLIQLPSNTYIDKTLFTKNAARLTLEDGREITISGADKFSYNVGGNITDGTKGTDLTFTEFAEVFGVYDILDASSSQTGTISDMYII